MREHLLGYLLGALEPTEQEAIERQLGQDESLRQDLANVRANVALLEAGREPFEPPAGLAARTCNYVSARMATRVSSHAATSPVGSWRFQDLAVAAGILITATMLLFPAVSHSRFNSRLVSCQNNLRTLGVALLQYSRLHDGFFPTVPMSGKFAVAGIYGPTLMDMRLLESPARLVCPASELAQRSDFRLPTLDEIRAAEPRQLYVMYQHLGGSYGYNLGYVEHGRYHGRRNLGRTTFPVMADAPDEQPGSASANHGGCGQNVLFEDGHAGFRKNCCLEECGDHIFVNRHNYVGPGVGPDDAVIAASPVRPVVLKTE